MTNLIMTVEWAPV